MTTYHATFYHFSKSYPIEKLESTTSRNAKLEATTRYAGLGGGTIQVVACDDIEGFHNPMSTGFTKRVGQRGWSNN